MNKRGLIISEVVLIVVNILLFSGLFYGAKTKIGSDNILEQAYAKQIALLIDDAKPGMIIPLNIKDVKDKVKVDSFKILDNKVIVKLGRFEGYSYEFASKKNVKLNLENDYLFIKIENG